MASAGPAPGGFEVIEPLDQIKARLETAVPGARLEIIANANPMQPSSLRLANACALEVVRCLRDDPRWRLDFASNVTGVDWPDRIISEPRVLKQMVDGVEVEFEEIVERVEPGFLEVVYHLYSVALKHGPLMIRLRTQNRTDQTHVPSLTPLYRGAEFQEREVYDLFGVVFDGHPDLRRLLMWDEFQDYPMRKDYHEPDDYEYEPTPHGDILSKARRHYPPEASHG
jgi:NADH-quinone oxidoreductase subunit C